jgi:hypothetical protein
MEEEKSSHKFKGRNEIQKGERTYKKEELFIPHQDEY